MRPVSLFYRSFLIKWTRLQFTVTEFGVTTKLMRCPPGISTASICQKHNQVLEIGGNLTFSEEYRNGLFFTFFYSGLENAEVWYRSTNKTVQTFWNCYVYSCIVYLYSLFWLMCNRYTEECLFWMFSPFPPGSLFHNFFHRILTRDERIAVFTIRKVRMRITDSKNYR